jgi:hypothetical protein
LARDIQSGSFIIRLCISQVRILLSKRSCLKKLSTLVLSGLM